ncbi:hypothetical protein ACFVH9_08460 [Streptomyces hirsutus]|uniref:hypothetical protein n=1 Tax=Streptomyces hirsutus TaxID=35620 RepID=UPI003631379C
MHATVVLAAAHAAPGINGMQLLGPVTVTGFAAASGVCLIAGLRGSDRIKIQNKDQALIWGFITGTLWVAAGGTWADFANGLGDVGKSMTTDTGLGDPGLGGSALLMLLIAWAWPWKKRMIWPALLGLMGAVLAGQAGGLPGILVSLIRSVVVKYSGG